jgi:hypothetical protein
VANFDVALSVNESTLNQISASLFARPSLRARLFSGSKAVNLEGVQTKVDWQVQTAPTVSLRSPTSAEWAKAIAADGTVAKPTANAMIVHVPKVAVTRTDPGAQPQSAVVPIDVICTITVANQTLVYNAPAVIVDLSAASEFDRALYQLVIVPQVLAAVAVSFAHPHLPAIDFQGLKFGPPVLVIGGGKVMGVANLEGKPTPPAPDPASLPSEPFYVLFSPDVVQRACKTGTAPLIGQAASTSGSKGFAPLGNASYSASVRIDDIAAQPTANPTVVNVSVALSASASAGVTLLGGIVGAVTDAANTVAHVAEDAAKTVADGVTSVANKIADAFHGY